MVDTDRFKDLVERLEKESAEAPGAYRTKVVMLTLLGFAILALILATLGFGLLAIAGIGIALVLTGGKALILLLKLGKLLFLLAIPLWYTLQSAIKALFVRLPAPVGRELTREEAPALFAALDDMREKLKGPRFHHVLIVDEVNAAVVQRPAFGLVGWPRNYLLLGLPLMERLSPEEALAVVAHEYGHLAGEHSRFSAYIYRLRFTWATVQAYMDHFQGWLGRLVAPLVRWYAPYFNAYTFVLARADEYVADAASARLVGPANAINALKRVNLVAPDYQQFMQGAVERVKDDAAPPKDLMNRWASRAHVEPEHADAKRWLDEALDREGHVSDTHPTLRARLSALSHSADELQTPPPAIGESASQAWFGPIAERLRSDLQERWAEQVSESWAARHKEVQEQRKRLQELRDMETRDTDRQIEMLNLTMKLEPDTDVRDDLAAFNAGHANHAFGLFLEGIARLEKGEHEGLALLDRAMEVDPDATKAACERAYAFLAERKEMEAAERYASRWRERDAQEARGS